VLLELANETLDPVPRTIGGAVEGAVTPVVGVLVAAMRNDRADAVLGE
jgi:hypothetical protein